MAWALYRPFSLHYFAFWWLLLLFHCYFNKGGFDYRENIMENGVCPEPTAMYKEKAWKLNFIL